MAAKFTEVTLEDMDRFLKRAYRALRPKRGDSRGEVYYDLNVSRGNIFIRVWTSIRPYSGTGAGVGQDAIRVMLVTKGGKPLMPKGKIVKRTQNWKNSLQDRIEELLEVYESKTEYWRGRQQERDDGQVKPKDEDTFVDKEPEEEPEPEPRRPSDPHEGTFASLPRGGDWGAKIPGRAAPGDPATLSTKGGKRLKVFLKEKVWSGQDRFLNSYAELWTFEKPQGKYAADEQGESVDLVSLSVAERYLSRPV